MLDSLSQNKTGIAGFSLIEVLIAVFVIAIGVLGVSTAQLMSLKNNQSSYFRSQANFLVMDILDRMRANPKAVQDGHYDDLDTDDIAPSVAFPACAATVDGCSASELAAADAKQWASNFTTNNNPGLLPGSRGTVNTTVTGTETLVEVVVIWSESAWSDDPDDDAGTDDGSFADQTGRVSMTVRL